MVVHSHAVILMLLSLFPESFGIFLSTASETNFRQHLFFTSFLALKPITVGGGSLLEIVLY